MKVTLVILSVLLAGYLAEDQDMSTTMSKARPVIKVFRAIKSWSTSACMQKCSKSKDCIIFKFKKGKARCLLMKIELVKSKKGTGVTGIIPCKTTETTTTAPTTTTTTTTSTTTTTELVLRSECSTQLTLSHFTRNVNYTGTKYYCDELINTNYPAPDWQGPNWYYFSGDAGSRMPESSPDIEHCGTKAPGWLNTTHPQSANEQKNATVCFDWDNDECYFYVDVIVTNCQDYYVYYLPLTPMCRLRYCGTDQVKTANSGLTKNSATSDWKNGAEWNESLEDGPVKKKA